MNNKRHHNFLLFMLVVSSCYVPLQKAEGQEIFKASFQDLGYMLMINNYSELKEEERIEALKFLVSYLKDYDKNLYLLLQNELRAVSSLNRSSMELVNTVHCKKNEEVSPGDTYQEKLNKYRCHFLNINAQKKFLSLESVIDEHLNPLINNLELEMSKKNGRSLAPERQIKKAIADLKMRVARVKAIKSYYASDKFSDAEREINQVMKIFDV